MAPDAPSASEPQSAPSLLRSGALSLATSAAPLVVALIALPVLTRQLGIERLGLLSLAWAWLGYAALLDLGLGRAITRMVASSDAGEALGAPIGAYVATAHATLTIVGILVAVLGAILAPWYVSHMREMPDAVRTDAMISAILFAMSVPAITGASAPRAVLEARQQFRDVNLVRLPVSVATFAVPLLLLPLTTSLTAIAATLLVVRLWAWWRYHHLARMVMPAGIADRADRRYLQTLLRAGAWLTVSNVISPLMTLADRFMIGSLMSVSAVALYAVPWEAVTKLWIVPGALSMVLFPALSRASTADPRQLAPLHGASVRLLTLIVTPVCAIACLLAPWLLHLVGGATYTGQSVDVLRILAVGVAANCVATIPFTLIQASGQARWTAALHLIEVVPFGVLLWYGVQQFGIIGAASAWTIRVLVDAALLAWRAQAIAPLPKAALLINVGGVFAVAVSAWIGATTPDANRTPLIVALVITAIVPLLLWAARPTSERLAFERTGPGR